MRSKAKSPLNHKKNEWHYNFSFGTKPQLSATKHRGTYFHQAQIASCAVEVVGLSTGLQCTEQVGIVMIKRHIFWIGSI